MCSWVPNSDGAGKGGMFVLMMSISRANIPISRAYMLIYHVTKLSNKATVIGQKLPSEGLAPVTTGTASWFLLINDLIKLKAVNAPCYVVPAN
jgi:hypothetical protein